MKISHHKKALMLNESIGDGGFLQSEQWREFQGAVGHRTLHLEVPGLWANVLEHTLPFVGNYWYVPRGPVFPISKESDTALVPGSEQGVGDGIRTLLAHAKTAKAGWVRVEPNDVVTLDAIRESVPPMTRVTKAPHDMQPREVLVMNIDASSDELLKRMKPKTRYNIRLAGKKGVRVVVTQESRYRERFCDLVAVTAARDGIVSHPRAYYLTMMEQVPAEHWNLYVAEYEGQVIAANLMIFFGRYVTYLHGASGDEHREVMAPYLLQWQAIQDARARGCNRYDFGGVASEEGKSSWQGITRFKRGFAPETPVTTFPGAYDIVLAPARYLSYRWLQRLKSVL